MNLRNVAFVVVMASMLIALGCGGSSSKPGSQSLAQPASAASPSSVSPSAPASGSDAQSVPTGSAPVNLVPPGSGQLAVVASTSLAAETGNNTSAASSFVTSVNNNIKPGSVSKISVHSLLYPGHTTKIFAHYMPWWGSSSHINIGLNEGDPAVVAKQVDDARSRGYDGFMIDWYGPGNTGSDKATQNVKAAAEATPDFEFGIVEDSGSLTGSDPTSKLLSDIQYMNDNYFSSPRYMRWNNRPVVAFFLNSSLAINWATVRAQAAGNPLFIFRDNGGFTTADSDGSFDWVGITGNPADMGMSYLDSFMQTAKGHPTMVAIASSYKGFDDTGCPWGANRKVNQQCGQTWLAGFAEVNKYYSTSNQLPYMQIPTWNDYEEGTEIETGIDNCVAVTAALSGQTLTWSITGQESTLDHYNIHVSADGQNLMPIMEVPAGTHSVNLSGYNFAPGTYTLYVQAIGKPGLLNHMSGAVAMTR